MTIDLRLGRWQEVLMDVSEVSTLIVDAPYSERTHSGHAHDGTMREASRWTRGDGRKDLPRPQGRRAINYGKFTQELVVEFCAAWSSRVSGWFVSITDHVLAPVWASQLEQLGRYVFAPLPFVELGSRVRLSGDGPSSWTCWIVVSRPKTREFQRWGTLPGAYVDASERKAVVGGKPLGIMRAIVRDYSRPGDLVCDPCAGGGTTLLAAAIEGRRAVGAECMPEHFEIAQKRIAKGFTPTLFEDQRPAPEQLKLGGGE